MLHNDSLNKDVRIFVATAVIVIIKFDFLKFQPNSPYFTRMPNLTDFYN